jgi:hypothetical protein
MIWLSWCGAVRCGAVRCCLQDGDLGDLDDGDHVAEARGAADLSAYGSVLDQFLQEHGKVWDRLYWRRLG